MPPPVTASTARLLELFAIALGGGIPAGAAAYAAQDFMSPEPEIPSVTTFTHLPLISTIGPKRGIRKKAGVLDALGKAYTRIAAPLKQLPAVEKNIAGLGGLTVGGGIGYGLTGRYMQSNEMKDLDAQLSEKEKLFNQLLLQEQTQAAGIKAAELLDDVVDIIFEDHFEKEAAAAGGAINLASSDLFSALLAIIGAGYGAQKGWSNTLATDKNRAVADALRSSLDERLMGNPEGPRAPMVVKVTTDRIGATPVAGGSGKSSGRDVLGRL